MEETKDKPLVKIKKKRGRKPKSIINSNKTTEGLDKNSINDNMIIKLKIEDLENNNILPGYSGENINEYKDNKCYNCWNCCHEIKKMHSIPLKCVDDKFYIYGDFCSLSCSFRYIVDNYKNRELWEKYELFNLYNRKIYGKDITIKLPPNKLCLEYFGGNIHIDDYRESKFFNEMNNPIIIPVKNNNIKKNTNTKLNSKGDLKLYRKSKNDKNIVSNMNL